MKNKKISKNIFKNILIAVAIMVYFILINFSYYEVSLKNLILGLKILSMAVMTFGIILLEIAYKKDNGITATNGVELLILAGYTLSIVHVITIKKISFAHYILISSFAFAIYYILKAVIIRNKENREYIKSLSDIKEIVQDEPQKKEAKKRKK